MVNEEIVFRWVEKDFFVRGDDGKLTRIERNDDVERVITTCIALWDYFKQPEDIRLVDISTILAPQLSGGDLLVLLCSDVEDAMNVCLDEAERELLFDRYQHELKTRACLDKYNVSSGAVLRPLRDKPLVKLARYLIRERRWDRLKEDCV